MTGLELLLVQLKAERQRLENELTYLNKSIAVIESFSKRSIGRKRRTLSPTSRKKVGTAHEAKVQVADRKTVRKAKRSSRPRKGAGGSWGGPLIRS